MALKISKSINSLKSIATREDILRIYEDLNNLLSTTGTLQSQITSNSISTNIRTIVYKVGVAGVTGCDYNFTSTADALQQTIQLGGTDIIPVKSPVTQLVVHCTDGLNTGTGSGKLGLLTGANTYMSLTLLDDTDETQASSIGNKISSAISSVWFSYTPSANWNTLTNGTFRIFITYIDNSLL